MVTRQDYDGFISYSHAADRSLAKELQHVLHRLGRSWYHRQALRIFRDDAALAASPDLWDSIQRALLSARKFVLLASPESAASSWVGREVALWREMRSQDDFLIVLTRGEIVWDDAASDFDWEQSTALPEQVRGWFDTEPLWVDVRGYHSGKQRREFRAGAAAVAAAIHGVPKDVLLGEDARQQRRLVAVLSSLLVLALVAGTVAVWQRNTAITQRDRADQQARVALSRALAAESDVRATVDPRLAAQLAGAAYGVEPTSEAKGALLRALDRNRHIVAYPRRGTDQVSTQVFASSPTPTHVALTPDGSLLAFAHLGDTAVTLWDTRSLREVAKLDPGPGLKTSEFYSLSSGLSFSGDGKILAADDGIRVQLWDVPNRRLIRTIEDAGGGYQLFLSADGRWVARTGDRRRLEPPVRVWYTETGQELPVPALADEPSSITLAFDETSARLYAEFQDGIYVLELATRDWSKVVSFRADRPIAFAVATKSRQLVISAGDSIELRELATGRLLEQHPMPAGTDQIVATSADAGTLVAADAGRLLAVHPGSDRVIELATLRAGVGVSDVAISADGRTVASISTDGDVILSSPVVDHRVIAVAGAPDYGNARTGASLNLVTAAAVDWRGELGVIGRRAGLEVWELPHMRMRTRVRLTGESDVRGVTISPDQTMAAALEDGVLTVADARSGTVSARIPVETPRPPASGGSAGVQFVPDGQHVLVDAHGGPTVVRVSDQERTQQLPVEDGGGFAMNTDASVVAVVTEAVMPRAGGSWIEIWRWQGARYARVARFHESALVREIAVSPDGTRVVLDDGDGILVVLDVADPGRRRVLKTPTAASPGEIAFTRDGTILVQAESRPGGISLWDIDGERLLVSWRDDADNEGGIGALDVGVEAQTLTDREGGGLVLWQANVPAALRALCTLAGELGPDDQDRYLPDAEVPQMCVQR